MSSDTSTIVFLSKGVVHPDLPPQKPVARKDWHPLRQHLMFMEDREGMNSLIVYYHGLLMAVPTIASEFQVNDWRPRHLPALATNAQLSPQDGRLSLEWRPDGTGSRICRHSLKIDGSVSLDGEMLPSTVAADGAWQVQWPEEYALNARVAGDGDYDLFLRPRSYDLTHMLATVNPDWLADADLLEMWSLAVWEWQKVALLWVALKEVEGA